MGARDLDEMAVEAEESALSNPYARGYMDGHEEGYRKAGVDAVKIAASITRSVTLAGDPVNHPPHYTKYPVEVIELTRHMSFGRGNAVKYIARAGLKSKETELEDLRKALFYIQDEIAMLEGKA